MLKLNSKAVRQLCCDAVVIVVVVIVVTLVVVSAGIVKEKAKTGVMYNSYTSNGKNDNHL